MYTVSFITAQAGKDLIVSFAIESFRDPAGIESLTLVRTPVYERFLPREDRGVHVSFEPDPVDVDDYLQEVQCTDRRVSLVMQRRRFDLDLEAVEPGEVERVKAVLERMNFDGTLRLMAATPSPEARTDIMLELLDSDDPWTVGQAIVQAQEQRDLIADRLVAMIGGLTPEFCLESNLPMLAFYLLAKFRDTRALEPMVRFFESGCEEAEEACGDVVTQDLAAILVSVCGGDFTPIRRLIETESASEWARSAAVDAFVIAALRGMRSPAEVERELEELMRTRLERRPSFVWSALADATGDLASSRLLPWIEEACKEGLVDESAVTLEEIRSDVRFGRKAMLEAHRRRGKDRLIDDVAAARSTRSAAHREGGHSSMLPALQVALRIAAHFGGEKLVAGKVSHRPGSGRRRGWLDRHRFQRDSRLCPQCGFGQREPARRSRAAVKAAE